MNNECVFRFVSGLILAITKVLVMTADALVHF